MTTLTQEHRGARLETPLGKDALVVVRFEGTEGLSELFDFTVETASEKPDIDFDKAIGKNCALTIESCDKTERVFNGVLVTAQAVGGEADLYNYRLVLRPWLWLLSRTSDCRIFENQTAPDIIKQVFTDRGFSDFEDKTDGGSFPKLDYCVQYRETDLAFASRLMEQHGIYYFFEHDKDKHMLVLADRKSSHERVPGHGILPVFLAERQGRRDQEHLTQWFPQRRFRTGRVELKDYDYLNPDANMKGDAESSTGYSKSKMEIFDYPGKYAKKKDGESYAKVRLQAEQAADNRAYAKGDAVSLFPGGLVKLDKHPKASENKEYLVVRTAHSYSSEAFYSGMGGGETLYSGDYEFLSSDIPYRAPLTTPQPLVHGPQTAKVVGKEGEEIDVDEHGRILVRFFWDRKNKQSCRVRVAQVWAGSGWGGQVIPRIGQEVIVEFIEGDPDRPLVIGTVYNGNNKYPFAMPANKTQSGLKTNSTKGGGGYNEFMFEDKKGSENIRMHAQKDYNVTILNTETFTIGEKFEGRDTSRETTLKNGSDELTIENGDQTISINSGEQKVTASKKITLTVGNSSITLEPAKITIASPTINVQSDMKTTVSGGMALDLLAQLIKIN